MKKLFILFSLFAFSAHAETPLITCNSANNALQSQANPPKYTCVTLGAGSVTTTGTPANGNLTQFSGANSITNGNLSGDATTSGTLAVTVTKTNGVAFAPSATTDTTNASNISSGTLPLAQNSSAVRMTVANNFISNSGGI